MKSISVVVLTVALSPVVMAEPAPQVGRPSKSTFDIPHLSIPNPNSPAVQFPDSLGPVEWVYAWPVHTSITNEPSGSIDYKLLIQAPDKNRNYKLRVMEADPRIDPKFVVDPNRQKKTNEANKALVPMPTSVTSPAGQEPRQP